MKNTYLRLIEIETKIEKLSESIKEQKAWSKNWQMTFTEKLKFQTELSKLENILIERRKERLTILETLSLDVTKEIHTANSELRFNESTHVFCDGLILENDSGL